MDERTRNLVRSRAGNACEYCWLPQSATPLIPFHLEHVVAKQHGGSDDPAGLALACDRCNAYKGPKLTSIDPDTEGLYRCSIPELTDGRIISSRERARFVGRRRWGERPYGY